MLYFVIQVSLTPKRSVGGLPITIPEQFSRATMERLKSNEITDSARNEIISAIAIPLYQLTTYPTSDEYTSICKSLIEKYPVLKDSCGNGYVSLLLIAAVSVAN